MSREQIADDVWGDEYDPFSNLADVYVSYLRRKLGQPPHPYRPRPRLHAEGSRGPTVKGLPFRARLTLEWTASFALLLAGANLAIYLGARAISWAASWTGRPGPWRAPRRPRWWTTSGASTCTSSTPESVGLGQTGKFAQVLTPDGRCC